MIIGTGIDIIEVARIEKAAQKERFLQRVFTERERAYFQSKNMDFQHVAGCFAAKEAVSKALATGFQGFIWNDIEILHDENGKPCAKLYNGAKSRMEALGGKQMQISISHIREMAVAQAILED